MLSGERRTGGALPLRRGSRIDVAAFESRVMRTARCDGAQALEMSCSRYTGAALSQRTNI